MDGGRQGAGESRFRQLFTVVKLVAKPENEFEEGNVFQIVHAETTY